MPRQIEQKIALSFSEIFAFRNLWMLFAILWVVYYHSSAPVPGFFYVINRTGYGGVDIFLFASGIGCFYSLSKDQDALAFLSRRARKFFPMWLPFLLLWLAYQFCLAPMSFTQVCGNLFGVGDLIGLDRQFNWYIGAMWICYLLAPLLVKAAEASLSPFKKLLPLLLVVGISFAFWGNPQIFFWTRLPIFFLGILAGQYSQKKEGLSVMQILLFVAVMVLGFAWLAIGFHFLPTIMKTYGLYWYPFILIVPGLVLLISLLANALCKTALQPFVKWLTALGGHTFSLYLSHLFVFSLFGQIMARGILPNNFLSSILAILSSFLFAYLLCLMERLVLRLWDRLQKT